MQTRQARRSAERVKSAATGGAGVAFLEVRGLSAEYGGAGGAPPVRALEGASLSAERGECVGVAGASACGKSTLGLAVMRSLQGGAVTSGSVTLGGESVLAPSGAEFDAEWRWKRVSMVFQGAMSSLDPVYTVGEQLAEALDVHGAGGGDREGAVARAVESVGLDAGVLSRYPHELSGGMKQRVVIALALLLRPCLVIADEPTTALDVLVQAQIVRLLRRLKSDDGATLMVITHDLAVLSEIADRIAVMYAGQVVEFGPADRVYKRPLHPYTQGLLSSIPTLRGPRPGHISGSPPGLSPPPEGCRFAALCPRAFERCSEDPPEIPAPGGYVRCWLYEGGVEGDGAEGGVEGDGAAADASAG